jgi:hypothetical protein
MVIEWVGQYFYGKHPCISYRYMGRAGAGFAGMGSIVTASGMTGFTLVRNQRPPICC